VRGRRAKNICRTCRRRFASGTTCARCQAWWTYHLKQPTEVFVAYLRRLQLAQTRVKAFGKRGRTGSRSRHIAVLRRKS
jgi:hypothetical protein